MREMVEKEYSSDPEMNIFCHELLRSVKEMKADIVGASHSEGFHEKDLSKKRELLKNKSPTEE